MKQTALSYFQYPELILIPFILFFLIFSILLIIVTRPKNKELYKKMEMLPLEEEDHSS